MELIINMQTIQDNRLDANLYCYLYSLYDPNLTLYNTPLTTELEYLQEIGFIKLTAEGPVLTSLFKTKFNRYIAHLEVEGWIEDWRNLFPSNVESSGRPVKGSKAGCLKKMKSYMQNNPGTTKEEIFEATRVYIFKKRRENWSYMTSADYFIEKNNVSLLDALVEQFREFPNILKELEGEGDNLFMQQL